MAGIGLCLSRACFLLLASFSGGVFLNGGKGGPWLLWASRPLSSPAPRGGPISLPRSGPNGMWPVQTGLTLSPRAHSWPRQQSVVTGQGCSEWPVRRV